MSTAKDGGAEAPYLASRGTTVEASEANPTPFFSCSSIRFLTFSGMSKDEPVHLEVDSSLSSEKEPSNSFQTPLNLMSKLTYGYCPVLRGLTKFALPVPPTKWASDDTSYLKPWSSSASS